MFNLFKKKSPTAILEAKYKKAMEEAYAYSTVNRAQSDAKYAEAENIMKAILQLKEGGKQ